MVDEILVDNKKRTHRKAKPITLSMFRSGTDTLGQRECIELSIDTLAEMGQSYNNWVTPFSGGKDSGATVSLVLWAIKNGLVPKPKRWIVLRSNTGQELPELDDVAEEMMQLVRDEGFEAITVEPRVRQRFYVQVLGRGLLPVYPGQPGRWCTRSLKVDPMKKVIDAIAEETGERFLMMSGVRLGESAQRDAKLIKSQSASSDIRFPSCSSSSGECGAGGIWMNKAFAKNYDALPLIVHWRECFVFDWLQGWVDFDELQFKENPTTPLSKSEHGAEKVTRSIANLYGQSDNGQLSESSSRFGCIGCSAVDEDKMLAQASVVNPELTPLMELNAIWSEMRLPEHRLWKTLDNEKFGNPGCLTLEAREYFLEKILDCHRRAGVELITESDLAEIKMLIAAKTFPRNWTGDEIRADKMQSLIVEEKIKRGLLTLPMFQGDK